MRDDEYLFDMPVEAKPLSLRQEESWVAMTHKSKHQGDEAELLFDLEACRVGLSVSRPITEGLPYDRILDNSHCLLRVQVKSSRGHNISHKGKKQFRYRVQSSHSKRTGGSKFDGRLIDLMAVLFVGWSQHIHFIPKSRFHKADRIVYNPNGTNIKQLRSWDYVKSMQNRDGDGS